MANAQPAAQAPESSTSDSGRKDGTLGVAFRIYKSIFSPILHAIAPSRCLYLPTCSEYAYIALSRFGIVRGSWLALRRFARCHPWGKGGLDPVPARTSSTNSRAPHPATSESNPAGADHLP